MQADGAAWLGVPGVPRERGGTERLWKVKTEGQALLWVLGAGRGASSLSPFCLLWLSAPGTDWARDQFEAPSRHFLCLLPLAP